MLGDRFSWQTATEGIDTVTYFTPTEDIIEISAGGFGGDLTEGFLSEEQFNLGSSAGTLDHRFLYDNINGGLYFDQDGTGAIAPVQFASVALNLNITHNNFEIVA